MKYIAGARNRRWGYGGWALLVEGASRPLDWTWCTTREECREVLREKRAEGFFTGLRIRVVKVKQTLEVVDG